MIDQAYVNQCQRFFHARSDQLVGLARLLDARRMIVIHDARCSTLLQRELHNLTRMHRCSVDRATEEIDALDDPVPFIEQDQSKDLVVEMAQPRRQVFTRHLWRLQRGTATYPMRQDLSRRHKDCLTRCRYYRAVGA